MTAALTIITRAITPEKKRWEEECTRLLGGGEVTVGQHGERPLGKTRGRWKDNMKMDIKEIVLESVHWIGVFKNGKSW